MAYLSYYNLKLDDDRIPRLVKEPKVKYYIDKRYCYADNQRVIWQLAGTFGILDNAEEGSYMLAINTAGRAIGFFRIGAGSPDLCPMSIRSVFTRALLCGASSVILIHNHPSGNLEPSVDDIETTRRMIEAGNILEISVADHIIVSYEGYYSMRENDVLSFD